MIVILTRSQFDSSENTEYKFSPLYDLLALLVPFSAHDLMSGSQKHAPYKSVKLPSRVTRLRCEVFPHLFARLRVVSHHIDGSLYLPLSCRRVLLNVRFPYQIIVILTRV